MERTHLPHAFADVEALEEQLSHPDADVTADLKDIDGDILILGATGKMGPTLARMAKRGTRRTRRSMRRRAFPIAA